MVAVNLNLDNLTIVYDNNMSHSRGLQICNPAERFASFGCEASKVNGHDVPTASLSSYPRAVEITQILKEWIESGKFLLTEAVTPLPGIDSGITQRPFNERPVE